MRSDIVWSGVMIISLGALLVIAGGLLNYAAYEKLLSRDYDEQVEGLNDGRRAEVFTSIGIFLAFLGLALGLGGMTLEEPEKKEMALPQHQWQPTYQQPPVYPQQQQPQYPEQGPPQQ